MNPRAGCFLILVLALFAPHLANAAPALVAATPNAATVPAYGLFELTLDLRSQYTNPFNPDEINVGADFMGPDGHVMHVNGFWFQDFTRSLDARGREVLKENGTPSWRIWFAPDAPGTWRYVVSATDSGGTTRLKPALFKAAQSDNPGFVRVSKRNPRAFAFAGEKPYFAIGQDMCWGADRRQTYDYDDWLPRLHSNGGNWVRLWSVPWRDGLEWTDQGSDKALGFRGLGQYNLMNAWRLDHIFDTAAANKVYCQLAIGYHGELNTVPDFWGGSDLWKKNPYSVANGGPCASPAEFWTNPVARKLYEQRLRYIGARYGWRTNIQAWEFWNEVKAPPAWIREMAQSLKGTGPFAGHAADPFHHLVTTTYGNDEVWQIPEVDFTENHHYGEGNIYDLAPDIAHDAWTFLKFNKPHLMAEFGIDWRKGDQDYDPTGKGVSMHDGIWAASAAGDAGTAMLWYWDCYIEPKNLYGEFTPIAKVAAGLPWTAGPWSVLTADQIRVASGGVSAADTTLPANGGWAKLDRTDFDVVAGATLRPIPQAPKAPNDSYYMGAPSAYSYPATFFSPGKKEMRARTVFHVDYPKPGKFLARINMVSNFANLRFLLDGKEVAVFRLDAAPPKDPAQKPEYQSTSYKPQWSRYQAVFDKEYGIDVPAGKHTIELDNSDGDWVSVSNYRLTNYGFDNVHFMGVAQGRTALLWLQNTSYNWKSVLDKAPSADLKGVTAHVHGLPLGVYVIDLIDTTTGNVYGEHREKCTVADGLTITAPELKTDVAIKVTAAK